MNLASGAGFLVMVAGLIVQFETHRLFSPAPLAILVQVAALLLMVWARLTFGLRSFHATAEPTAGGIVTTGPYRWLRHPIYAAAVWFSAAGVAAHADLLAVACGAVVLAGALLRMRYEERMLLARYPEYRAYAARTARIVPGLF